MPHPQLPLSPAGAIAVCFGIGVSVKALQWCVNDYKEFLSLGRGGLPMNIFGWVVVNVVLKPIACSPQAVTATDDFPETGAHEDVLFLPEREGERAVVKGIAPHRQFSQLPDESMRKPIQDLFDQAIEKYPDIIESKPSLYELFNPAIFVRSELAADPKRNLPDTTRISRYELGHFHGQLSVHLYLAPADAKVAIDKGWAERHRIASRKSRFNIASTYLMIYGPRTMEELDVLRVFLERSISFMTDTPEIKLGSKR